MEGLSIEVENALNDAETAREARCVASKVHEQKLQEAVTLLYLEYGGCETITFSQDHRRKK